MGETAVGGVKAESPVCSVPVRAYKRTPDRDDSRWGTRETPRGVTVNAPVDAAQQARERTTEFIGANKDRSFLVYLAHTILHVPLHVRDAFRGRSANDLYGNAIKEIAPGLVSLAARDAE